MAMIFNPRDIEHFIQHGFIKLAEVFSPEEAARGTRRAFESLGCDINDPATWNAPSARVAHSYLLDQRKETPKLWAAACELVGGAERLEAGQHSWSDFLILNLGHEADKPWAAPDDTAGWHKDGDFFRHFLDSPEQALLVITLWSDISDRGGGTFIAPQSIGVVARYLLEHPEGVHPGGFPWQEMIRQCPERIECTGQAGDAYLVHPFMLHTISANPNRRVRAIANMLYSLAEPMKLDRPEGNYSPVERAVLRGLGADRVAFAPARERFTRLGSTAVPK